MDVASLSTSLAISGASTDAAMITLKKSMDASQGEMAQLLQGLPAPQPAHLGQNFSTQA